MSAFSFPPAGRPAAVAEIQVSAIPGMTAHIQRARKHPVAMLQDTGIALPFSLATFGRRTLNTPFL